MLHINGNFKYSKHGDKILNLLAEIAASSLDVRLSVLKGVTNEYFLSKLDGKERKIGEFLLTKEHKNTQITKLGNKLIKKYNPKYIGSL